MDISRLESILQDVLNGDPSFQTVMIVSIDGLPLASASNSSVDEEKLSAVSSLALSTLEKAASEIGLGKLSDSFIRGDEATVFIYNLDNEGALVAVADNSVKLGLALYQLKNASKLAVEVLKESVYSASSGEQV